MMLISIDRAMVHEVKEGDFTNPDNGKTYHYKNLILDYEGGTLSVSVVGIDLSKLRSIVPYKVEMEVTSKCMGSKTSLKLASPDSLSIEEI
jgi:hypothetical protein